MSPTELMFTRKIRSVFDKLIPSKKEIRKKINTSNKTYSPEEKYFLKYHLGKATWLEDISKKRIGNIMYVIKHPRWKVCWHIIQIKKRYTPNTKERVEEQMSVIYIMFEVPRP